MKTEMMIDFFENVETEREYIGYYYSVAKAMNIVIPESICSLKNVSQINPWTENQKNRNRFEKRTA